MNNQSTNTFHSIKESDSNPGQFNIFRASGGDGGHPLFWESTGPHISYWKADSNDLFSGSDKSNHLWYLELQENGNYRIRQGIHYVRSLLHNENRLVRGSISDLSDPTEFEFIFDCFDQSDHIGGAQIFIQV